MNTKVLSDFLQDYLHLPIDQPNLSSRDLLRSLTQGQQQQAAPQGPPPVAPAPQPQGLPDFAAQAASSGPMGGIDPQILALLEELLRGAAAGGQGQQQGMDPAMLMQMMQQPQGGM